MTDIWIQIVTIIGSHFFMLLTVFGIIWWFRKESREDWKIIHQEMKEFKEAIRAEMKDFHERLLKIEMERK